jgi:hypothetical protein
VNYNSTTEAHSLQPILAKVLFKLKYITTGGILIEALNGRLITEGQGNVIWKDMLNKQRKLPAATFSDYLAGRP